MNSYLAPQTSFLLRHSRGVILAQQRREGAFPACENFSAYRGYSWFRDGSFVSESMSVLGELESAADFHDWCASVVLANEETIHRVTKAEEGGTHVPDREMLPTRFTFSGEPGDDDWWDFQLDGYGIWAWAVSRHCQRHNLDIGRWEKALILVGEYLSASWKRACFDWWEEHDEHIHTSTLGCVASGLLAIASATGHEEFRAQANLVKEFLLANCVLDGRLTKWVGSKEVDGSLLSLIAPLGLIPADSSLAQATISAIDADLLVGGGVRRFKADTFFGGGRWPLLSCFRGLTALASGNVAEALELMEWVTSCADSEGNFVEQMPDQLSFPEFRQEWVDRWGNPANPLLWSHAMYILLALDIEKYLTQGNREERK